ncbi:hypothetical protein, partial [Pseudomonas sp. CCI2.4]
MHRAACLANKLALIKLLFNLLKTMGWRGFGVYIRPLWLLNLWFRFYSEAPFSNAARVKVPVALVP